MYRLTLLTAVIARSIGGGGRAEDRLYVHRCRRRKIFLFSVSHNKHLHAEGGFAFLFASQGPGGGCANSEPSGHLVEVGPGRVAARDQRRSRAAGAPIRRQPTHAPPGDEVLPGV